MTMKKMLKQHPNRLIVCIPAQRDKDNRPTTFKVLNTCRHSEEACEILARYEKEGEAYANTIIIPNFPESMNDSEIPQIAPSIIAKTFRVLYGMQ